MGIDRKKHRSYEVLLVLFKADEFFSFALSDIPPLPSNSKKKEKQGQ